MGTGSYLLVGTDLACRDTFASTMHGSHAKKAIRGEEFNGR